MYEKMWVMKSNVSIKDSDHIVITESSMRISLADYIINKG